MEAVNACQAFALKFSVPPSRSVVSLTRITPARPTSTQLPPLPPSISCVKSSGRLDLKELTFPYLRG